MSDDEVFAFAVAGLIAVVGAVRWYIPLDSISYLGGSLLQRLFLGFLPPACIALLVAVLLHFAALEVRNDPGYIALFATCGAAAISIASALLPCFGVSFRGDGVERHNPAAIIAIAGALFGVTFAFAGSNIGEGETIWTTIGPAALVITIFFLLWLVFEALTRASEAITIERDAASGIRLLALLLAFGLVLGRSAAGDYVSADATLHDVAYHALPVLPLLIAAVIFHYVLRPTVRRPLPSPFSSGILPGLCLLAVAGAGLVII